jgi:hypothetical protein
VNTNLSSFHIPGLTAEQAEARYRELAAGYQVPVPPHHRRIARLTYKNPEQDIILTAEVGKAIHPSWSTVMAILPGPPVVVVCDEQHKHSFIVPEDCIVEVEMFGCGTVGTA